MKPLIKILIADDYAIIRIGLVNSIKSDPKFEVIAECSQGVDTLNKIRQLKPDIAILDISMPEMDGFEVIRRVKQENLPVKFVILTMYKDYEYFQEALSLGVNGYLIKENAIDDIIDCLNAVIGGDFYKSDCLED